MDNLRIFCRKCQEREASRNQSEEIKPKKKRKKATNAKPIESDGVERDPGNSAGE